VGNVEHYFVDPSVPSDRRRMTVGLGGREVEVVTDRGVFSKDEVDDGTRVLLDAVPPPAGDHLLDLGCGWGPITLALAFAAPEATVWAVDVNPRARELCADNARSLGLTNVRVAAPDEVPAEVRFGGIWSNPPIRIGKPALHELLTTWLGRLADGGEAYLVVAKNLGSDSLLRWLQETGFDASRYAAKKPFRVLRVSAGPAAGTSAGPAAGTSGRPAAGTAR
jgi:16S rRNA (guanine1207-N2)-methyltransferase